MGRQRCDNNGHQMIAHAISSFFVLKSILNQTPTLIQIFSLFEKNHPIYHIDSIVGNRVQVPS
jgi:hypothetical protein